MSATEQHQQYIYSVFPNSSLSCNNNNNNTTTTTSNVLKNSFYKNNIIYTNNNSNNNNTICSNNISNNLLNNNNNNSLINSNTTTSFQQNQNIIHNNNNNINNNNSLINSNNINIALKEENLSYSSPAESTFEILKNTLLSNLNPQQQQQLVYSLTNNNNNNNNINNSNQNNNNQNNISTISSNQNQNQFNNSNNNNYHINSNQSSPDQRSTNMTDIMLNSTVPDYFEWCAGIINMPNGANGNNGNKDDKSDSVPSPNNGGYQSPSNEMSVPSSNNNGFYSPPQPQQQTSTSTNGNNNGKPHCSEPTTPTIDDHGHGNNNNNNNNNNSNGQQNSSPVVYSVPSYYVPNYGVVLSTQNVKGGNTILPPQAWTNSNNSNNNSNNYSTSTTASSDTLFNMSFGSSSSSPSTSNDFISNSLMGNTGMFGNYGNSTTTGFQNFLQFQNQLQNSANPPPPSILNSINQQTHIQQLQHQLQQQTQQQAQQQHTFNIGKPCNINQKKRGMNNIPLNIGNQSNIIISHPGVKMEQASTLPQQQQQQQQQQQLQTTGGFLDLSSPESHHSMSPSSPSSNILQDPNSPIGVPQHWESGLEPNSLQKQNEINPPISVRSNVVFFEPYHSSEPGRHKACWNLLEPMHRNYYQPIQFKLPSYPDTSLPITQIDEKSGIFDSERFHAFNNNPQGMSKYESYRIYIHPSLGYSGNAKRFKQQPDVNEKALILDGNVYDGHLNPIYNCKICTEYYQTKSYFSANPHAKGKVLLVKNNILTRVKDGGFTLSLKPMCCSGHNSHIPLYFHFTLTNPLTNEVVLQSLINVNVKQWKKSVPNKSKKQRFE